MGSLRIYVEDVCLHDPSVLDNVWQDAYVRKGPHHNDRSMCLHTASSSLRSLQYDVPQDCLRAYRSAIGLSKRRVLSPDPRVLSPSPEFFLSAGLG